MKVLIADKFPDQYIQKLKDAGIEVIYNPKLGENDLPEAAKEVDFLVPLNPTDPADFQAKTCPFEFVRVNIVLL